MNKIFYTLGFLLIFTLFNNEAKAQLADVALCTTNASGAVVITAQINSTTDQLCDTSGTTNLTVNIYSLGFCTSAPTINFVTGGKAADERDFNNSDYSDNASNFSSCTWTIKQSTATSESLSTVKAIEPLPNDEIPPPGRYTHAVIIFSNEMTINGSTTFSQTIRDTTTAAGTGTKCWTNGSYFVDTGKQGPLIGSSITDAVDNMTGDSPLANIVFSGGATCGSTPGAIANTIVSIYSNHEPSATSDPCSQAILGRTQGCNTTRSEENTAFGLLKIFFTTADTSTLSTNSPDVRRSKIVTTPEFGRTTQTNTLTGVFAYNTPMLVTDKTTGIEIFVNFNNALALDFEPSRRNNEAQWTNTLAATDNASPAALPPRIRAIQSGPFGIQFKAVEGGGIN